MRFLKDRGFHCAEREVIDNGTLGTWGFSQYCAGRRANVPVGWSVSISVAPYRLEVSLDVSDGSRSKYSVWELLQLEGSGSIPQRQQNLYEAAQDPEMLRHELDQLTSVLRQVGGRFFSGNTALWSELAAQRSRSFEKAGEAKALSQSEQAFQAKDWVRVVQLLEPIEGKLSGAAALRLAYAKKRAAAT